jgi:hypothetical protein
MPSHRPTIGRNVAEKGLKPFSFCFCVKPQLRHYFPSVLGRTNCNWVSMGMCWVATLWRLPSGTPQWRESAFVHYFGGAVNTQKLCFHSQKNLTFQKTMVATRADNPKCVSCTARSKLCTDHCRLLLCVCDVLCVALQWTASSWAPLK